MQYAKTSLNGTLLLGYDTSCVCVCVRARSRLRNSDTLLSEKYVAKIKQRFWMVMDFFLPPTAGMHPLYSPVRSGS